MKFHCDRCKTRYSIADERVRGKILKIRCKNCSAVITVREDMEEASAGAASAGATSAGAASAGKAAASAGKVAASAKPAVAKAAPAARGSALRGAFEQVMARPTQNEGAQPDPSPSQSFRAPDHFEEEWYVSEDGDQVGPFSLPAAKEWVQAKSPEAELYCWQEDFDDWLPVDKVSHFRGLRAPVVIPAPPARARPAGAPPPMPGRAPAGGLGRVAAGPVANPDPQPLFTATMNRLEQEQRKRTEDPLGPINGKAIEPRTPAAAPSQADANAGMFPDDDEDDLDLDIGEASRIVNLAMIMPPAGGAEPAEPQAGGAGLPGVAKLNAGRHTQSVARIGRGSGEQASVGMPPLSDAALADAHPPILTPVAPPKKVPLVMLLLIGGAVMAGLVGLLIYVAMSGEDGGDERLSRSQVSGEEFARRGDYDPFRPSASGDGEGEVTAPPTGNGTAAKPSIKRPVTPRDKPVTSSGDGDLTGPRVPGDLGVEGLTALRPQEVITMSSRQGLGSRRCYERALKKDPFLDVKNIKVQLTVAPSGVVTEVKLASQAQSFLGQCLAATIRTWPFRKSTKGITMDVTLSFEQQG